MLPLSHLWLFCSPMDCSLSGSSVHGISQVRILEGVAISNSRGSSWPRNWTSVSYVFCTGRWTFKKRIIYLFLVAWVFVAAHCGRFFCCRAQALGTWTSVVVVHRLSCSIACGIFLHQGSNPCPLHWGHCITRKVNTYTSKILFWFVHEWFLLKLLSEEMSNFCILFLQEEF